MTATAAPGLRSGGSEERATEATREGGAVGRPEGRGEHSGRQT